MITVRQVERETGSVGLNAVTGEFEDLLKAGVIDPAKVTRSALQNAASVAAMALTTECLITDVPEGEPPIPLPEPDRTGQLVRDACAARTASHERTASGSQSCWPSFRIVMAPVGHPSAAASRSSKRRGRGVGDPGDRRRPSRRRPRRRGCTTWIRCSGPG